MHETSTRCRDGTSARNDIQQAIWNTMEGIHIHLHTGRDTPPPSKISGDCMLDGRGRRGDDFCAFTFLFPLGRGEFVKTRCYISSLTLAKLPTAMRRRNTTEFIEGSLQVQMLHSRHDGGVR